MERDIKEILFTEEELKAKVKELAQRINRDYTGKKLVLIGVLKGASVFLSDLMRQIEIPLEIDFIAVSSYGNSALSSGVVRILKDLDRDIDHKDVILVEDIVDTGLTLNYLLKNFKDRKASSVRICTLLDKPERRKADIEIDYVGFQIPDEFIVGYGIDYAEKYRNLPYVAALKREVYT
ncbi:MAG: hypoxanthine phosphoribosyltransferase [delta proteobacterium ML8_F1]|nr:MAG: hypoxanthine phosphoribosyltransferase [delta proteobacterium ML8_F1]